MADYYVVRDLLEIALLRVFMPAVRYICKYARVRAKVRVETRFAAFHTPHPCPATVRLTSVMYLPLCSWFVHNSDARTGSHHIKEWPMGLLS